MFCFLLAQHCAKVPDASRVKLPLSFQDHQWIRQPGHSLDEGVISWRVDQALRAQRVKTYHQICWERLQAFNQMLKSPCLRGMGRRNKRAWQRSRAYIFLPTANRYQQNYYSLISEDVSCVFDVALHILSSASPGHEMEKALFMAVKPIISASFSAPRSPPVFKRVI